MRFSSNSVKLSGRKLIVALALLSSLGAVTVQAMPPAQATAEAQIVQATTSDGRTLEAQYWALPADLTPASGAPTVVVMHALYSNQRSGLPLVEPLLQAGYNVLFSDWRAADSLDDVQIWLDWLRDQPGVRPDAISTLGSGVGGSAALIGCANDDQCVTAIAVSPGIALALSGLPIPESVDALTVSALSDGLRARSALLISTHTDPYSEPETMIPLATGEIGLRIYTDSQAREGLFTSPENGASVINLIVSWLDEHTPAVS